MRFRWIDGHQHRVKGEKIKGSGNDCRVPVSGNSDESSQFIAFGRFKRLDRPFRPKDHVKIFGSPDIMNHPEVEIVSFHRTEGGLQMFQRAIPCPFMRLAGKEDIPAPFLQGHSVIGFAARVSSS